MAQKRVRGEKGEIDRRSCAACGAVGLADRADVRGQEWMEKDDRGKGKTVNMCDGLQIVDLESGEGVEACAGQSVVVHYTGWLTDGSKFDSSVDRDRPFSFRLGVGQVIAGWDQGVAGMKVGGKRKLTIPPDLAYGETGAGGMIPPSATLVFEVELLEVR